MKPLYLIALLGPAALLAACGEKAGTNVIAANTSAEASGTMTGMDNMSGDMGNMAMPAAKTAKGSGTVTAIDTAAGTITLDHGPIAEAGWPAMTMAFKAAPALRDSVKVGDKVAFELKLEGGSGEVTSIAKQ
ncbi:copper-binding protein [Sphingomonas sp. LB-2]|uniref:copper-binding protein n=1 Tax=Sphingomonas caeni TaxID=2984949 RepID=UPI00223055D5|nr:copper-binding protein [Sphingomonas caeni]MCW3847906.1 copper-binding protein [Sphingomonas caeni]